jgi:alpha-tubulin suppressor-like RCC1 family protein
MIAECGLVTDMPDFPSLPAVQAISAGGRHVLALLQDGSVRAWGCNEYLQATLPDSLAAANTEGVRAVAVAAGATHSLALMSDGSVLGWGDNSAGQIDNVIATFTDVAAIAAGQNTTLLHRTSDNSLWYLGVRNFHFPRPSIEVGGVSSVMQLPEGYAPLTLEVSRWFVAALLQPSQLANATPPQQEQQQQAATAGAQRALGGVCVC